MYLTREQLEKLSTKRLLAYKKKHSLYNGIANCDICMEICPEKDPHKHCCKYGADYLKTYDIITSILNTREHVERKKDN